MDKDYKREYEKSRDALSCIALEIQRFHDAEIKNNPENYDCGKVLAEIIKCKSKLKQKRLYISKLRKKCNLACLVAKTVATTKHKSESPKSEFAFDKTEFNELQKSNENNNLQHKLEAITNFIQLGYKELKRIRDDCDDDPTILMQLKKLIVCCGQYYADYCNENETCKQLLRRNGFLLNKISILETNLQAAAEYTKVLEYKNSKLQTLHDPHRESLKTAVDCHRLLIKSNKNESFSNGTQYDGESGDSIEEPKTVDLNNHLIVIKQLLNDQDNILEELKNISLELYF